MAQMDSKEQRLDGVKLAAFPANGLANGSHKVHSLSLPQRILLLVLNALPLLHVIGIVLVVVCPWSAVVWRLLAGLGVLYLLPPLAARVIVNVFPFRSTVIASGSVDFFKWWALFSMQVLFCRLPFLEEAMRLIPSAYSAWLRLWGSRIGRLVYWSPGTSVLDRSFIDIGDNVIFGAAVRMNPHVMVRNEQGELALLLATVKVGARTIVGGYTLLTAGSELPADEATRACLLSPPFSKWQNGKRVKE